MLGAGLGARVLRNEFTVGRFASDIAMKIPDPEYDDVIVTKLVNKR